MSPHVSKPTATHSALVAFVYVHPPITPEPNAQKEPDVEGGGEGGAGTSVIIGGGGGSSVFECEGTTQRAAMVSEKDELPPPVPCQFQK